MRGLNSSSNNGVKPGIDVTITLVNWGWPGSLVIQESDTVFDIYLNERSRLVRTWLRAPNARAKARVTAQLLNGPLGCGQARVTLPQHLAVKRALETYGQ
jgi:hypothetical protein